MSLLENASDKVYKSTVGYLLEEDCVYCRVQLKLTKNTFNSKPERLRAIEKIAM